MSPSGQGSKTFRKIFKAHFGLMHLKDFHGIFQKLPNPLPEPWSQKTTIPMDFGPLLDPILPPFWSRFGLIFGSIFGPPPGGHFERKHKENQRFSLFGTSEKAYFWSSFWLHFWLHFGSFFAPFPGALCALPKPLILHSLEAGQA